MAVDSFPGLPPLPDDVPTADLSRISYTKLQAGDNTEGDCVFQACKGLGFFLLDLRDSIEGSVLLSRTDQSMELGKKVFDLDEEEKSKYRLGTRTYDG